MDTAEHALLQKAYAEGQAGNFAEAERICLAIVASSPFNAVAWSALGAIAIRSGQADVAVQRLHRSIECDPRDWATLLLMVQALRSSGARLQAAEYANRTLKIRPNDPEVLLWTAICCIEIGAFLDADKYLAILRNQFPDQIAYTFLHAQALTGLGRDLLALRLAETCVAQQPNEDHLSLLLKIQVQLYRFEEAVTTCRNLLAINSESSMARVALASALSNLGKVQEAEHEWQEAVTTSRAPLPVHLQIGYSHQQMGLFEQAEADFKLALALQENNGEALYAIFSQRNVTSKDRDILEDAQAALRSSIQPSDQDRRYLNFALGKAFHDLENYAAAMMHYDEANRILRTTTFGNKQFDPRPFAERIQLTKKLFTKKFLAEHGVAGLNSDLPIFVVGMMRSGTTIVHQILSSHAIVGGAGDLAYWVTQANSIVEFELNAINSSKLAGAAAEYEDLLRYISPESRHVVDKNPANLINIGLLFSAFPKAKFIFVRRRDIDIAMSLWTTPLESNAPFLGDREAIVYTLGQTEHIFQHWRATLPKDSLLEIQYEDLVKETETIAKKMIAFCGLDWDDACLHPESNQHLVRTPSFWQVRQKVSAHSVDRYKPYEPWLGPFSQLLRPGRSEIL